ncbi:hypothetical protein J6590_043919 [Homalodisca vitripennis]|nr:hypothetical protein J6590_043919 [Homalodisca vitripennis]
MFPTLRSRGIDCCHRLLKPYILANLNLNPLAVISHRSFPSALLAARNQDLPEARRPCRLRAPKGQELNGAVRGLGLPTAEACQRLRDAKARNLKESQKRKRRNKNLG